MSKFVEFTAANGGFPVYVNPDAVVSIESAGYGTAVTLSTRETLRLAEPAELVIAALGGAQAAEAPAPPAASREKK